MPEANPVSFVQNAREGIRESVWVCVRESVWEARTEMGSDTQTVMLKKKEDEEEKRNDEKEKQELWTPVQRHSLWPLP